MKRVLLRFHCLVLVAVVVALSSCDSGSKSTDDDTGTTGDDTVAEIPAATVAAPVFSPAGGSYASS